MNLKYYLRGLGIGIIVTALVMGITAAGKNKPLSDSEIIERAKALGMTEESTLLADAAEDGLQTEKEITSDEKEEADEEQQMMEAMVPTAAPKATAATPAPAKTPEATTVPTASSTPIATNKPTVSPTPLATPTSEPTVSPTPYITPTPAKEDTKIEEGITIQINSGDGSYTVCKKLEEAGLIASASDFDTYLCDNGYDKRLNVGSFIIPEGAQPEEIAKILARLQ